MNNLFIKNAIAYIDGSFQSAQITVTNGKISSINDANAMNYPELDACGKYLLPGFIDIHTHGANGVDVNLAKPDDFEKMAVFFASCGVTSFLASILTDTVENTISIINNINDYNKKEHPGAALLGVHLEGPFLSKSKKGAMPENLILKGDIGLFEKYAELGCVKYITVAPEDNLEFIGSISNRLPVAIGHSSADYETAIKAVKNGAKASTHTFNAMAGLDRVEPSILGAAMDTDIYNEIIADGKHVHPSNIRLLYAKKGDKMIAITDSIQATGMGDGDFTLGGNDVTVSGADAYLKGTKIRAGSVLTMNKALKNLMEFLSVPLEKAIDMLTKNPADLLGLKKGRIAIGYDGDFVITDENINIFKTVSSGSIIYEKHN